MIRIVNKSCNPARLRSHRVLSKNPAHTVGRVRYQSSALITPRHVAGSMLNSNPLFEFGDFERNLPSVFNNFFSRPDNIWRSRLDIDFYETKNEYHIDCDVPGFKKNDVKVEWDDDYLVIEAKSSSTEDVKKEKDIRYFISERSQSQTELSRKIRIPRDANMEEVHANFNNGILSVTVPKNETHKKEILVSSSED
mmetsp:Transcript_1672/g.3108  ORF Transcript_1672/g.3108 Transcript_1672/m.3108 type:complete len:195 (+) Transcript_1672:29-613(+)